MRNEQSGAGPNSSAIMRALRFFDGPCVRWFVILTYGYFFFIIIAEVVMRHIFSYSTTWGEMTARYAFVYFAYMAAAEAFRHDEHIRIDFLPNHLGGAGRKLLETYIDLLCIGVSVIVIWYSIRVMDVQIMAQISMHSLPLNLAFAQAALPLGWGVMIIRILQRLVRRFGNPDQSNTGLEASNV